MSWWKRRPGGDEPTGPREDDAPVPASFELFETWVEEMDPKLAGFEMFGLPEQWSAKHYTRAALVELQDVMRDRLDGPEQVTDGTEVAFVDGAIRYVGETLIRQVGGRWVFQGGRPQLVLDVPDVTEDDPVDVRGVLQNVLRYRDEDVLGRLFDIHRAAADEEGATGPAFAAQKPDVDPRSRLGQWLASMDEAIEAWRQGPAAPAERWDGSVASLELLGPWMLETFGTTDPDVLEEGSDQRTAFVGACRYLGETVRRHGGGQWVYPEGPTARGNPYAGRPFVDREDPENGETTGTVSVEIALRSVVAKQDSALLQKNIEIYLRSGRAQQQ